MDNAIGCLALPEIEIACSGLYNISGFKLPSSTNLSHNDFQIFPNPASENIQVWIAEKREVQILNAMGQQIKNLVLSPGQHQINISDLAKGIYFMSVDQQNTQSFIKK